jgi:hypothetical protein
MKEDLKIRFKGFKKAPANSFVRYQHENKIEKIPILFFAVFEQDSYVFFEPFVEENFIDGIHLNYHYDCKNYIDVVIIKK